MKGFRTGEPGWPDPPALVLAEGLAQSLLPESDLTQALLGHWSNIVVEM